MIYAPSIIIFSAVSYKFGNEPARSSDASGPHPNFDQSLFASTAWNRKQDEKSDCPDASDGNFGGRGFLRFRLFVFVDHVFATSAVFAYVFIWLC